MTKILRRAAIPITALALISVGVAIRWDWTVAAIVLGGLLWIDLSIPSPRPAAARSSSDASA